MRTGAPFLFGLIGLTLTTTSSFSRAEAADVVRQCIDASENALALRKQGRLIEARKTLAICSVTACGQEIKNTCEERIAEITRSLPNITFEAKEPGGTDVVNATATIDGVRSVALKGQPLELDPGTHAFKFEAPGHTPVEQVFMLAEAAKGRRERVVFTAQSGPPPQLAATEAGAARRAPASAGSASPANTANPNAPNAANPSAGKGRRTAAAAVGGAGLLAMGAAGLLGLTAKASYDGAVDCRGNVCTSQRGYDERESARRTGNAATILFIAGGAAAAAGAVLWLTAPKTAASGKIRMGLASCGVVAEGEF